jgi:uncharacterized protein (DUF697 family)
MIGKVAGFIFDTAIGKGVVAGLAAVALFTGWLWRHDARVAERVETKIITKAKEAGKVANAKATKAHDAARRPGAAERVRSKYCADCN